MRAYDTGDNGLGSWHTGDRPSTVCAAVQPRLTYDVEQASSVYADLLAFADAEGIPVRPTGSPVAGDPVVSAERELGIARRAATERAQIMASLPELEVAASRERKRTRDLVLLLSFLGAIVLAILIGQVL